MKEGDFCALKAWKHFQAAKVSSTMQIALEASLQYPQQRLIITAQEQTAGRGRYNRTWVSPPGNFYGTFVIPYNSVHQSPLISYGIALAVLRAVRAYLAPEWAEKLALKWPNDILLAEHKIAGVLLDVHEQALLIGIGVNLKHFPPQTSYPATSLYHCAGMTIAPLDFLVHLVDEIDNVLAIFATQGFEPLRLAWLEHRSPQHQTMRITQFYRGIENSIQAEFIDLDHNGLLQVRNLQTQEIHEIAAGDIFFKK
jgi:birA, biotin-[acetyl-CoA-carboxylase] ligase region